MCSIPVSTPVDLTLSVLSFIFLALALPFCLCSWTQLFSFILKAVMHRVLRVAASHRYLVQVPYSINVEFAYIFACLLLELLETLLQLP